MITETIKANACDEIMKQLRDEFSFVPGKHESDRIKTALRNYKGINTDLITVVVDGDTVTLSGIVKTKAEKEEAQDIAMMVVPGITKVNNSLNVDIEYVGAEIFEF